jgi:CubicO group peptidase (beta-lactamase class C family)
VYKKTYADLLHEKILSPLKFSNTGVYNQLRILPDLASGYHLISDDSLVAAPYRDFFTNDGWRKYVFYSLRSIKMVP